MTKDSSVPTPHCVRRGRGCLGNQRLRFAQREPSAPPRRDAPALIGQPHFGNVGVLLSLSLSLPRLRSQQRGSGGATASREPGQPGKRGRGLVTAMRRRVRIWTNRGAKTAAGESRRENRSGRIEARKQQWANQGARPQRADQGAKPQWADRGGSRSGWGWERGIGARSAAGGMTALSLRRSVRGDRFQMHHYRYCAGDPLMSWRGEAAFFAYLSLRWQRK